MLRDEQDVTPEITQTIVDRFRALLGRLGKSETWAARSLDIKPSTLSQVLSGTYEGDSESRIRKIDKWTEIQISRENSPRPTGFAKTSVATEIIGAAKVATKMNTIVVVHGPSGIGKSLTAEFVRSDTPGAIYINISTAGRGLSAIWDMLARELRVPRGKLTAYQTELAVREVLRETDRLIIVDEIHKLCGYKVDQGLHTLRDLHDATRCPMLWLGTADVATFIENGRETVEAVEQIYGRVGWWVDLTYAASRTDGGPGLHTIEDIRACCAAHQMRITPDAAAYLHQLSNEPKMGGLRTCIRLCQIAQAKGGDKPITHELLADLQAERLGRRAAKVVEAKMDLRKRRAG